MLSDRKAHAISSHAGESESIIQVGNLPNPQESIIQIGNLRLYNPKESIIQIGNLPNPKESII